MSVTHQFHPSILREYDIRGVAGKTLHVADALHVGRGFAAVARAKFGRKPRLALGYDGRLSSPDLQKALVQGLVEGGAEVIDIGVGPTPLLYFAVHHLNTDGGIMVTGSHNPPDHNGFKFMLGKDSFFGQAIMDLAGLVARGTEEVAGGSLTKQDVSDAYIERMLRDAPRLHLSSPWKGEDQGGGRISRTQQETPTLPSPFQGEGKFLRVGWDPGNGAAGEIVARLIRELAGEHHLINAAIDGTFPSHHPDPSEEENLEELRALVSAKQLDIGIAFDGDADRIGVVDGKGRTVFIDQLLLLYAKEVAKTQPGALVIADVKASRIFFEEAKKLGVKTLMSKTGHSHIKYKMKETGAAIAGEVSGHMFFTHSFYGHDDAIYAALRLLDILAETGSPAFTEIVNQMPATVATPDLRIAVPEGRKFEVVEEVRGRLVAAGTKFNDVDGMRVEKPEGWWLLRASNTAELVTVRAEATNEKDLAALKAEVAEQLKLSGVTLE